MADALPYYIRDLYAAIPMPDILGLVVPETASYESTGIGGEDE